MRQLESFAEPRLLVRAGAWTHAGGFPIPPQAPEWDKLLLPRTGAITVRGERSLWLVPAHRALWLPRGQEYRLAAAGTVSLRTLFFVPELAPLPPAPVVVDVPPLLRELVLHAARVCPLDEANPSHHALVAVICDRLAAAPTAPLQLPYPRDDRARKAAELMLADPAGESDVADVARECAVSRRSLERLFIAETGLPVGQWRRRARLLHGLRLLSANEPVTAVSLASGYSTPSAFAAAFREMFGTTPSRYRKS